jgi:Flp pilus assembly protein TadB
MERPEEKSRKAGAVAGLAPLHLVLAAVTLLGAALMLAGEPLFGIPLLSRAGSFAALAAGGLYLLLRLRARRRARRVEDEAG